MSAFERKTIYFVRHAEAKQNVGRNATTKELTPEGILQAQALAQGWNFAPDLIVTSSYIRTKLTARPLIERFPSVPVEEWPVQEWDYEDDNVLKGKSEEECCAIRKSYWEKRDPTLKIGTDAESLNEGITRVQSILERIKKSPYQNIVIFSHGWFMNILRAVLCLGTDDKKKILQAIRIFFTIKPINNASVMRLRAEGDRIRLMDNRIPKSLRPEISARDVDIIVTNFKCRYTGVMTTLVNLLPEQQKSLSIAVLGHPFVKTWQMVGWGSLLRHGWSKPASGKPFRIWHCRRNHEMLVGWLLRDLLRMKLRLVFTSAAQRDHTAWTKFLLSRMDIVIATSPESAAFLKVPYVVNMHGVVTDKYIPATDRAAEWAATGLGGKYGIGVFGRVRHQKGTDRFVELMCELLPQYPDWTAVIVGEITPDQKEFADKLKSKVAAAGLEKRIHFLGLRPAEEVPLWLRRVTIVVGPQRNEGFGLVPAEAQSAGTTVVATRAGAAAHLINDGETGYLADIADIDTLRFRISELMKNPERAEALGRAGREHIIKNFSVATEAAGIKKIYERVWSGELHRGVRMN
jgi:mannosyltransferase